MISANLVTYQILSIYIGMNCIESSYAIALKFASREGIYKELLRKKTVCKKIYWHFGITFTSYEAFEGERLEL